MGRAGRPSKYKAVYCRYLEDYFRNPPKGIGLNGMFTDEFPTLAGFAGKIGVHIDTINEWTRRHKKFGEAVKRIKPIQMHKLIVGSLMGHYNAPFAKFVLQNVFGWREKSTKEHTGPGGGPILLQRELSDNEKLLAKELARRIEAGKIHELTASRADDLGEDGGG